MTNNRHCNLWGLLMCAWMATVLSSAIVSARSSSLWCPFLIVCLCGWTTIQSGCGRSDRTDLHEWADALRSDAFTESWLERAEQQLPTVDPSEIRRREIRRWGLPEVTLIADKGSLADVALDLADQCSCGVVVPQDEDLVVSVALVEVNGEAAFRELARQVELQVEYRNGVVVFVDSAAPEDFVLFRPPYELPADMAAALTSLIGEDGEVVLMGSRVVVVGSASAAERAAEFVSLAATGPDGWLIEVVIVEVSRSLREALGLDVGVSGEVSIGADAATGSAVGSFPVVGARAAGTVSVVLQAAEDGQFANVLQHATLYLLEGSGAEMRRGESVPVPRRAVSDFGTVTTEGYTYIDSGLLVRVEGQRVPEGLLVELTAEVSDVIGFVDEAPIRQQSTMNVGGVLRSGEWLVMVGLDAVEDERSLSSTPGLASIFGSSVDRSVGKRTGLLFCRATRVFRSGGGVVADVEKPAYQAGDGG